MPQTLSPPKGGAPRLSFLPTGTFIGFIIAIVAVLVVSFVTYRSLEARTESGDQVQDTFTLIGEVDGVLNGVNVLESAERGFLLTGSESALQRFGQARAELPGRLSLLKDLSEQDALRLRGVEELSKLITERIQGAERVVSLRQEGRTDEALAQMEAYEQSALRERIRTLVQELERVERSRLEARQEEWDQSSVFSMAVSLGGALVLLVLVLLAAWVASRDHRERERQVWVRTGQMGLSLRMQEAQQVEALGEIIVTYLAHFLGAQVGRIYVSDGEGRLRQEAGYALPSGHPTALEDGAEGFRIGEGLVGQVARDKALLHLRDVPRDYLPVGSGLGRTRPHSLVVVPAIEDRQVQGVVELGFLRAVTALEVSFLEAVSEAVAVAVGGARDRRRLEELLEETQRQSEELQTQQEELRVVNEELEEQGHALRASQARLETQQTELEQSNVQLEEHTQSLERQKEDLTQSRELLTAQAAELERSNQYKSEFLANMSHELRTPLNSSLILAKLLADNRDGNLTDEQVHFARSIYSAGNDLLELINDILDLSKIEAGKVELQPEPIAISQLTDALRHLFEPLANEKSLTFNVRVDAAAPEHLETDSQRLQQILKNLLSNAFKFTPAGGTVTLLVQVREDAPDALAFAVRDTGIGIAPEQQDVVFEAFRQADGTTNRRFGGTGLGLSISRDLARLLGGSISLESQEGKGSTFTLIVPVQAPPAEAQRAPATTFTPPPPPAAPATPRTRTPVPTAFPDDRGRLSPTDRTLLVIEDDVAFAQILCDLARELKFRCIVSHEADEGVRLAQEHLPAAIILDMGLPDHSGLTVLDRLKRNPKTRHLPVQIISATDQSQTALEMGAAGYLLKPVRREEIAEALERLQTRFSRDIRTVLVVEDDPIQRESMEKLLGSQSVRTVSVATASEALSELEQATFDCMVLDLSLPDATGYELLERMAGDDAYAFPPVIVYTGRSLDSEEEQRLQRYSRSIIIKGARSPERLLDEVTLFLHQVEASLPADRQRMLQEARDREAGFEGRTLLLVEDDVRNIFALSRVLEPKGAKLRIARNGREALEQLAERPDVDIVLMDIMMPEMDGYEAMREIRKRPELSHLPIIALTAKAMRDDQERCLSAGANDYVAKPIDVEKLLSLIRVWMPK